MFVHTSLPSRVVFGPGRLDCLPDEVAAAGFERALVLSTPRQRGLAERLASMLGRRAAGVFDQAVMHVPVETVDAAIAAAERNEADSCVAFGGGSTIGLGKAIALRRGLPYIAIATTYAGSEMTTIWGPTASGAKQTGRDPRVLPRTVIYDPELTLALPPRVSGPSGMNAIAHCVEALYADDANPVTSLMAEEGVRALATSLPVVVATPDDLAARSEALYGAWLAGSSLGAVGMALHHKLCHTLGGTLNVPHAETHTAVLPHAVAYNAPAAPEAMTRVARAVGSDSAAAGLFELAERLGATMALRDLGMKEQDIDAVAELASANAYPNPRPVTPDGMRGVLEAAFHGRRPGDGA